MSGVLMRVRLNRWCLGALMFAMGAIHARGESVVIFGDLAPVDDGSAQRLAEAVHEVNLLRPAAVLTVGSLVPAAENTKSFVEGAARVRKALDNLQMPWLPCGGESDMAGGAEAYRQALGALYFSRNIGAVHVIVLNSEEHNDHSISERQLAWLRADLNKTFEAAESGSGVKWVIVLLHRPLWRNGAGSDANWDRVHQMLVDFNQRPIVSVEGGEVQSGPRVVGVWAGAARAYTQDPARDGIRYTVVGATAARIDQDPSVAVRHFSLLTFDDTGVHPALVLLGGHREGAIVPEDFVTASERGILDAIAALPPSAMGVDGAIDFSKSATTQPAATLSAQVELHLNNPLTVPLEVAVGLASAENTAWAIEGAPPSGQLEPGATLRWPLKLVEKGNGEHAKSVEVEFVVRWDEAEKGVREIVLKRQVQVIPPPPVMGH